MAYFQFVVFTVELLFFYLTGRSHDLMYRLFYNRGPLTIQLVSTMQIYKMRQTRKTCSCDSRCALFRVHAK